MINWKNMNESERTFYPTKVGERGQITIPKAVRDALEITSGDQMSTLKVIVMKVEP